MLTRRILLKRAVCGAAAMALGRAATAVGPATAAASVAAAAPAAAAPTSQPIELRVFDARLPASRAWVGSYADGAIDVAREGMTRWTRLRGAEPRGRVAGLTTWSDFVQVRGVLQDKGKRLRGQSRSGALFYWEMV
jgi:hypothetical protein